MTQAKVCVCLLTYNRLDYARRTLEALGRSLCCEDYWLHIADDGSPRGYVAELAAYAHDAFPRPFPITTSISKRRGYGGNFNLAMEQIHNYGATHVLPVEDDWELKRSLDLRPLVRALDTYGDGCIRLGYLGWYGELRGKLTRLADQAFLELDPDCSDMYVFSGHPRLETVGWQQRAGKWPEGLNPGDTELELNRNAWMRTGVLWPLDMTRTSGDIFSSFGDVPSYDKQVAGVYR